MVNEGILGIESREREHIQIDSRYCPFSLGECLGARDEQLRNEVCHKDYCFCSQYSGRIAEIDRR
ncbi:hypothetical protein COU53_02270 [Candidatus Pacearchaeota archaeon CG10_big_fil_rev_8_21_14_0_10_30_48]|nr:MAG: hypothetical protein COU53_02270 [Candidatus Pacearchaeota archaeon CG10_big_fil_rev_8_21_14_0_10_30_48]